MMLTNKRIRSLLLMITTTVSAFGATRAERTNTAVQEQTVRKMPPRALARLRRRQLKIGAGIHGQPIQAFDKQQTDKPSQELIAPPQVKAASAVADVGAVTHLLFGGWVLAHIFGF
jgi:hypothetical protein